jgi:hypothetical protein
MLCKSGSSSYTEHKKMGLQFLNFSTILSRIYKVLLKHLRGEETFCTQTPARFKSSQMCPRSSPPYPTAVGALAGGDMGPGDANKRAGSSIGLTRGQLATEARPGNDPVMAGGEATATPPRRRGPR